MSALSKIQKAHLAQLARRAFNRAHAMRQAEHAAQMQPAAAATLQEALHALEVDGSNAAFESWRHAHVANACGKHGLRCCDQLDYKTVEAHFLQLLGQDGRALNAHVRAETEPRRQAETVLTEACRRWGFHLNYAANLCQKIHKVSLFDASTGTIWKLIYTINNRGRARAKAKAPAAQHKEAILTLPHG